MPINPLFCRQDIFSGVSHPTHTPYSDGPGCVIFVENSSPLYVVVHQYGTFRFQQVILSKTTDLNREFFIFKKLSSVHMEKFK